MSDPFSILLVAGTAFVVTVVLGELFRRLCVRLAIFDHPNGERWHRTPRPRLGGVALFVALVGTAAFFVGHPFPRPLVGFLAGAAFTFAWGLVDDLCRLPSWMKLLLLLITGFIPALFGVSFSTPWPFVGAVLTAFWVTGVTNAVNWLDNMDGAAAGVSVIAAAGLMTMSILSGNTLHTLLAVTVGGAALGFLVLNFPPARIFMGDCGSGLLGYSLATIAVLAGSATPRSSFPWPLLGAALVLSVPLLDTVLVAIQRTLHARPILLGGRDHLSHRLVILGFSEREALAVLYGLGLAAGAAGLLVSQGPDASRMVAIGLAVPFLASIGAVGSLATVYTRPSQLHALLEKVRRCRAGFVQGSLLAVGLTLLYYPVIAGLIYQWRTEPDYSHGPLIPLASAYLLWRQRGRLRLCPVAPSSLGYLVIVLGIVLLIVGEAAVVAYLMRVSLLVVFAGLALYFSGVQMLRLVAFPLACLLFMIPMPYVVFDRITLPLQFLASNLATSTLDMLGLPVLREGNIITLPSIRLGVTEACSGIRSLMALVGASVIYSYLAVPGRCRRFLLVVSTVPIAILTNAARVAVTGILAETLGREAAMGFYHTFSGLLIFGFAAVLLALVGTALVTIAPPVPWRRVHAAGI